jgi:crotonobetainyl-CoA:carnitine CoA-transferase CaiB-like acyl-CoA transferase
LQVIDSSVGIAGAYCAKLLGSAGAEVVKIEPPEGVPLRRWNCSTYWSGDAPRGSALFRFLHHGHRSVVADDISELLTGADVLITDAQSRSGASTALLERYPRLIVVSITPYGLEGPYSSRPATELTVQAESGALAIRGHPSQPPVQAGGRTMEWVSGLYGAVGALAAVRGVASGGPGELIDLSMSEVANTTGTTAFDLADSLSGRPDPVSPARRFETPSIEPTADGYVGFNTNTRMMFDNFLVLIDRADLVEDGEWASVFDRQKRWDEWNSIVHGWTSRHSSGEIIQRAAELRIPVAPVCDGPGVVGLEHARSRGSFVADPDDGFLCPRRPWRIDGELAPEPERAPTCGEHTDSVIFRPAKGPATASSRLPLEGVRVLDLTAWWAGPSASAMLGDLGADVIHVESVTRPDGMRMTVGALHGRAEWWEYSALFLATNRNKRGLTLDLTRPEGRDLALRLVAKSDIVMENFTPRVIDHFDLGWDVVHATNARAVMVRMPAFGLDGPWRDRPGFAQTMEQVTGLAWLTGHVDDQPRIQRGPCDPNGGMHAVMGTLVALAMRDRTGEGHLVESSMFDAALSISAELVVEWTAYGTRLEREGSRSPWAAPQGVYATNRPERWLALSVASDEQWVALVAALGAPLWALAGELTTHTGRREHHDLLDRELGRWAAGVDVNDAVARLVEAGVPAAPAVDPRRTSTHPQYQARSYYEQVEHPVVGRHPFPGLPFRFSSVDRWIRRPPPTVGQHNEEILGELGCTADEIAHMEREQIIGKRPAGV